MRLVLFACFRFALALTLLALGLGLLPAPLAAQFDDNLDVPYVPTPPEVVEAMLKLGGVKKGETVIDLGCGDGRIVVMAAEKFGARGIGYDLNPERIKEANENARQAGVTERVKFIEKNLFEADISPANVVTLYLLPSVNEKLKPRLQAELKPGTRVVSHSFTMGDWKPVKEEDINGRKIYLWIIGK
ncbi:MAG: methyltransferase domain-containing protein [Acidobacteria bacterium]|nr:methyltransferase domain-containing protein [Acidobacteriota bacterium]